MKTNLKNLFLTIPEFLNPKLILYTLIVIGLVVFEGVIPELWGRVRGR